jgi:hypothetical protein
MRHKKRSSWDGILGRPIYLQRLGFQKMHIKSGRNEG